MPWVEDTAGPADIGLPESMRLNRKPDLAKPGFGDVLGAAWRQENIIGSTLSGWNPAVDEQRQEPGFNAFDRVAGSKYEQFPDRLAEINNTPALEAFKAQVDREEEDRRTLAAAGWKGMVATVAATAVDPTMLLPAGDMAKAGRLGYSVARSALNVGLATAAGVAVQEGALQATQETRPLAESALNIGGGAILGALVGAAGAKIMDNVTWNDLADRLAKETADQSELPQDAMQREMQAYVDAATGNKTSAGAAAVAGETLDQNTIAGRAARMAAAPTARLNPLLRALNSPSAKQREIMLGLMENPIYVKKNFSGIATAPAIETIAKEYTRGRVGDAVEFTRMKFKEARKAGYTGNIDDFERAAGRAARHNDIDPGGNQFVSDVSRKWRDTLTDPLKERAIAEGMLPEGIKVTTAESYFHRVYNRVKIEAHEADFKAVVRKWVSKEVDVAKQAGDPLAKAETETYINEVVDSIFNKVTGRYSEDQIDNPFMQVIAAERGPLKERVFNIPDEEIAPYLEDNITLVGRRYARTMSADIEMHRFLKDRGKTKFEELIKDVRDDYTNLRKKAKTGKERNLLLSREKSDIEDMKAVHAMLKGSYLPEQNSSNYARIIRAAMAFNYMRAMGGVVMASLSDVARPVMVHGLSRVMGDGVVPLVKNLKAFKLSAAEAKKAGAVADRILHGRLATMAELTDPYSLSSPFERFIENASHGFSTMTGMPLWNDFMKSFSSVLTQDRILQNIQKSTRHIKKSASGISPPPVKSGSYRFYYGSADPSFDVSKNTEMWVAPTEDYARNYRASPNSENTLWYVDLSEEDAIKYGVRDEINNYNRIGKLPEEFARKAKRLKQSAGITDDLNVDMSVLDNAESAYMHFLGIDDLMAKKIARQFSEHGQTLDGVMVANTDAWTDDLARQVYRAAINKDVDSTIVEKGIGDVPLFSRTPVGRAMLQFKGFSLASHQRVTIRGLQESQANFMGAMIAATSIGAFIYYLKSVEANRLDDLSDNPGRFIAEGLDRSGIFAIPFEVNNTAEKFGAPGIYTGLQAMFPDAMQKGPASRYAVRSAVDALLGPTIGMAKDMATVVGAGTGGDLKEADISAMRRLTPGASLPMFRALVDWFAVPAAKEAVQ